MKKLRYIIEFAAVWCGYRVLRLLPHSAVKCIARIGAFFFTLVPGAMRVAVANIHTAFPEKNDAECRRTARKSFFHLVFNISEFLWMSGNRKRIERWTTIPEPLRGELRRHVAEGRRIIFINPHIGSWEGSGLMAPHFVEMNMVAVVKQMRNPYLDNLFNGSGRKLEPGVRLVYSKGAMRGALKGLRDGFGIGILIDQNTRVRDGGVFVDFFGLPCPCSSAPTVLVDYCRKNNIPVVIYIGASLREDNGMVAARAVTLRHPYEEYPSATAILQEILEVSEGYIRSKPEQYLWFYKRFQYIPHGIDEKLRRRYPYYAIEPGERFYSRVAAANNREKD
ncbi:MAG: hypothetical protein PHI85_00320 [Victivallaceae bacterium]|nr:hypothetical protein [Victivallaceae bacterium]